VLDADCDRDKLAIAGAIGAEDATEEHACVFTHDDSSLKSAKHTSHGNA
jgi:hypothetical protein